MTYEEYMLSKQNRIVYKGQTENELKEIIRNIYGYNYEIIEEDKKYTNKTTSRNNIRW